MLHLPLPTFANGLIRAQLSELTFEPHYVQLNRIWSSQLHNALDRLTEAINEVKRLVEEMRAEHDPLATHIFIARRQYRNMPDTKSGKRHEREARFTWQTACDLGYAGDLHDWERLMGASARR